MIKEDNVIDNKKIILKDELMRVLPKTENASIAVGYFFISGLSVIIQPIKNVSKIRLLISNTTNKETAEALIEGFHNLRNVSSRIEKIKHVNKDVEKKILADSNDNVKQSLEYMEQTVDDKTTIEYLIEMMKTKQLEVRVYPKEKLHAKAYIFEPKDKDFSQGMGIVGSSNLSLAGISYNSELNLKTYNSSDVKHLLRWFDGLWNEALDFTDNFNIILSKSWAGKTYSPYDVFIKSLYYEYRHKLEEQHKIDSIWEPTFPKLLKFQKKAVDQCLTMIDDYGGVIIGDVVGLGKTYIGTTILKYLQLHDSYRPLIICPPTLISMWENFCETYEVDAKVLSRGELSNSDYDLSKDYRYRSRDLVLIDESHHFRNDSSRQYENLQQFMQARNAKAILLTATPFSNKYKDIKNQIMLFHQTAKTSIPPANETDLDIYFRQVNKGEKNLTDLLRNIMIRRTRRYVLDQWGKIDEKGRTYLQHQDGRKYFPKRKMETQRYNINKVYQKKYDTIVNYFEKGMITFARYSIGRYVKEEYQNVDLYKELSTAGENLVGLIRTLLLKRMESSLEAFKQSIKHYINTHKIFLELLDKKIIPVGDVSYKAMLEIAQTDPDSIYDFQTIKKFENTINNARETKYSYDAFDIKNMTSAIQKDLEIFETIDGLIHRLTPKTDDKLEQLQKILDNDYVGKKILIFTEFATTAQYLNKNLRWNGVKEQVDSSMNSIHYARRFDPDNNPSKTSELEKSEEISLLITTDVLSEGINLQAGEVIINYDFHWNPTRLIQRAGRVDRIGSTNEFVTVHNFLLDPKMKQDFKLEDLVDAKINKIQQIIGEDYEILKKGEKINTGDQYAIYKGDVSIFDREEENPLTPSKFEQILSDIQTNDKKLWDDIKAMPAGIRGSSDVGDRGYLLLACEIGTTKSGKVRRYYKVALDGQVTQIPSIYNVMENLESEDKTEYPLKIDYDKLVSLGWEKFIEDAEQIETRSPKLPAIQKWIIRKLLDMKNNDNLSKSDEIDTLRDAFSIPLQKRKLTRELMQIRKDEMNDLEVLDRLNHLYRDFELHDHMMEAKVEIDAPRILYSRYVGKST